MDKSEFDYQFYLSMLRTSDAVGMSVVKKDDLARGMAILYVAGNNELMTHSYKFMADMQFAQEKYHIVGGERPDTKFITLVKRYIREMEIYNENLDGYPDWAERFMKEHYGIKLFS